MLPEAGIQMYLRQLGGPPKLSLPWYDAPPYGGKVVSKGMEAGALLGPVKCIVHVPRWPAGNGKNARAGFVVAGIRNPFVLEGVEYDEVAGPAIVYVNVWNSDNNRSQKVGVS